jgi:hypothetical protein
VIFNIEFQNKEAVIGNGFSIEILKMWAFGGLNENEKPVRSSK